MGKFVHIEYIDSKKKLVFIEGILDYEFDEATEEQFIDITSDTDFVRIPLPSVKKIYLKE